MSCAAHFDLSPRSLLGASLTTVHLKGEEDLQLNVTIPGDTSEYDFNHTSRPPELRFEAVSGSNFSSVSVNVEEAVSFFGERLLGSEFVQAGATVNSFSLDVFGDVRQTVDIGEDHWTRLGVVRWSVRLTLGVEGKVAGVDFTIEKAEAAPVIVSVEDWTGPEDPITGLPITHSIIYFGGYRYDQDSDSDGSDAGWHLITGGEVAPSEAQWASAVVRGKIRSKLKRPV